MTSTNNSLSKSAQSVQDFMAKKGLAFKIIELEASTRTAQDAATTISGIPPIDHKQMIGTFIDNDLLKFKELWAAAGTPNAVFCLNSTDIQNLTYGKMIM